jgi:hypothetical protein
VVDRDADRLAHLPLAHQVQALESIVRSNPVVAGVLDQLPALNLGSWYIGAGGVAGTVWNHLHGYAPTHGIKDYDIVYFHAEDLSEPAEPLRGACDRHVADHRHQHRGALRRRCQHDPRRRAGLSSQGRALVPDLAPGDRPPLAVVLIDHVGAAAPHPLRLSLPWRLA